MRIEGMFMGVRYGICASGEHAVKIERQVKEAKEEAKAKAIEEFLNRWEKIRLELKLADD
jgi:predicted GIY-YIG superfamily endonuclease